MASEAGKCFRRLGSVRRIGSHVRLLGRRLRCVIHMYRMALRFPGWGTGDMNFGSNRVGASQLPEVPGTFVRRELREDREDHLWVL